MAEEEQVEPVKVANKFDNSALKQALDDAATKYLTEDLDYVEDHSIINWKIILGSIGCILALIAQFYPAPFPDNKIVLIICASGYFICSSILQYIVSFMQKDSFLIASLPKDSKVLVASSHMAKYSPDYTLTLKFKGSDRSEQITKPVTAWFDEDGVLVQKNIEKDVQSVLNQLVQKSNKKSQ
jgi:signal peptidase complex subunit 2